MVVLVPGCEDTENWLRELVEIARCGTTACDGPTEPMERHSLCEENRCIVSLHTIDTLEEVALEHLGIGRSGQSR